MQLDPDGKIRPKPVPWTPERTRAFFDSHYSVLDLGYKTPCWKWTGCVDVYGYGVIKFNGKNVGAHRYSAMIHISQPPKPRALACHACDQSICVNPDHLYWGDYRSNMHDMIKRGRDVHPRGELCSNAKLTISLVLKIRDLRASGLSIAKIASTIGVTDSTVGNVIHRKTWGHLP